MEVMNVPIEVKALNDATYNLYRTVEALADKEGVNAKDPDLAIYLADKILIQALYDVIRNHISISITRELIQEYHENHDDKKKRSNAVRNLIISINALKTVNFENPENIEALRLYYAQYYGEEEAEDFIKDLLAELTSINGDDHDDRQYL